MPVLVHAEQTKTLTKTLPFKFIGIALRCIIVKCAVRSSFFFVFFASLLYNYAEAP